MWNEPTSWTIQQVAHEKNFAHLQAKLKECIAKQSTSMDGLERLAQQLGNDEDASPELQNFDDVTKSNTTTNDGSSTMIVEGGDEDGVADANETTTARVVTDGKGENKAPAKKHRRGRKYSYMHHGKGEPKNKDSEKPKKKPKYFCQF